MRNRGIILLVVILAALGAVLFLWGDRQESMPLPLEESREQQLYNAVMDKAGVTRWSETMDWLDMEEEGDPLLQRVDDDTPVWIARGKMGPYHSFPACGGMKSPVRTTLGEAAELGHIPCNICWEMEPIT